MKKQLLNDIKISRMDSIERELVLFLTNPNLMVYSYNEQWFANDIYLLIDKNNYIKMTFKSHYIAIGNNLLEIANVSISIKIQSLLDYNIKKTQEYLNKYLGFRCQHLNMKYVQPLDKSILKKSKYFNIKNIHIVQYISEKINYNLNNELGGLWMKKTQYSLK